MTRLAETINVAASLDETFALVCDFSRLDEWDPNVASSRLMAGEPLQQGARLAVGVRFLGRIAELEYELIEVEPPTRAVYVGRGRTVTSTDVVALATRGDSTNVAFRADVEFSGYGRLLRPVIALVAKRQAAAALTGLKAVLG